MLDNVGAGGKLYRFNGIEHSEKLGLDLAEFRTYDPAIGRWLQVDPMAEYAPGWTPYRFGFNNPISYTDALGLFESKDEAKEHAKAKTDSSSLTLLFYQRSDRKRKNKGPPNNTRSAGLPSVSSLRCRLVAALRK